MEKPLSSQVEKWSKIDPGKLFIAKSVACVVIWRLLYVYILRPIRFPDKLLTEFIGKGTAIVINSLSNSKAPRVYSTDNNSLGEAILVRNYHTILRIGDSCNGLELMLIYIGVISLLPGKLTVKLAYIVLGTLILMFANMLRCAGLEWVYEFHRPMFETTHHYLFTLVMYVIIFSGWVTYISKEKIHEKR